MIKPDHINALFEFGGACAIALSVRRIARDKTIKGMHWAPIAFFTSWGIFNIFYYPAIDQIWSFRAGMLVTMVNLVYLSAIVRYWPRRPTPRISEDIRPVPGGNITLCTCFRCRHVREVYERPTYAPYLECWDINCMRTEPHARHT